MGAVAVACAGAMGATDAGTTGSVVRTRWISLTSVSDFRRLSFLTTVAAVSWSQTGKSTLFIGKAAMATLRSCARISSSSVSMLSMTRTLRHATSVSHV